MNGLRVSNSYAIHRYDSATDPFNCDVKIVAHVARHYNLRKSHLPHNSRVSIDQMREVVSDCFQIAVQQLQRHPQAWNKFKVLLMIQIIKKTILVKSQQCLNGSSTSIAMVLNLYKHAEPLRSFPNFCRTSF